LPSHHLRSTFIELSKILVVKDCKDELLVFVQILHHPAPFFHINQNGINHASKQEKEHHIKQAQYIPSHLGFRVLCAQRLRICCVHDDNPFLSLHNHAKKNLRPSSQQHVITQLTVQIDGGGLLQKFKYEFPCNKSLSTAEVRMQTYMHKPTHHRNHICILQPQQGSRRKLFQKNQALLKNLESKLLVA
jgi:hypothetical protein